MNESVNHDTSKEKEKEKKIYINHIDLIKKMKKDPELLNTINMEELLNTINDEKTDYLDNKTIKIINKEVFDSPTGLDNTDLTVE